LKNRLLKSIRTQLIIYIGLGAALAVFLTWVLYSLALRLHTKPFFHEIISFLHDHVGTEMTVFLAGAALFIAFVFLVTRRSLKYLEDIIRVIQVIESGNLEARIDLRSDDELGDLAGAINRMADKLKLSLEEERKSEAAKNEIISSVSHDLRTPLTSVIGFLGLLTNRGKHSEEDLEKFAAIAHKKALKLQELTDELFEYTKVSHGGMKLNTAPLNLGALLGQLAEEFYPVFTQNGMECRLFMASEKVIVSADGDLLARLFENLLNNAVRYGKNGKYVDVRVEKEKDFALVDIINYGDDIPPEKIPYIFDKFYRVETSRSRETGGTGLGLAIVKSIVELHKGTVAVTSGNQETCFRVCLPLN